MNDDGTTYGPRQLMDALSILCGPQSQRERVTLACVHQVGFVKPHDLRLQYREQLARIQASASGDCDFERFMERALTGELAPRGNIERTLERMSDSEVSDLASQICALAIDVLCYRE